MKEENKIICRRRIKEKAGKVVKKSGNKRESWQQKEYG